MKHLLTLIALPLAALWGAASGMADDLPKTWMTTRGKLLASEDFEKPMAPFTGKPVGFASGFSGWRYNSGPTGGKTGRWQVADGTFTGMESPEAHHPATASFGLQYKDAIIQCDVRLNDVPAEGRQYRSVLIKATDTTDYVISFGMGLGSAYLMPSDADRINPATKQRMTGKPAVARNPGKLNEWHTLVMEIKGDEVVGTVDGKSVALSNPLIATDKHSVMLVAATEVSFRHFRVWEALPNPEWPANKAALLAAQKAEEAEAAAAKSAATFRAEKLAELDATIEQAIHDSMIVGGALWVEHDGVAYHKAYGQRALKPVKEAMTEDTIFDVASVTKALAGASAAMLCLERGLFKLDDPVSQHLPEFTGEEREKVTIRHLLVHSSGLPVNLDPRTQSFTTHDEAIAQICRTKLLFEPGAQFSYSSVGTMLLGGVVERVTGRKFDEFCTTGIFKPLRMNDSGFRPQGEKLMRVAPSSAPQRGLVDDTVARLSGNVSAHASLFTTTADVARFARMMLNLGELDGVRVFKPETVKLMTSVQSPAGLTSPAARNLPVRRGLGWDIDTPYRTPPHDYTLHRGALFPTGGYGHTGWTGQMLWIDPFSRTFVIFFCNRYVEGVPDTRPAVYQMHHRISTLAAEAVKGFDFGNVPGALPKHASAETAAPFSNSLGMKFVPVPGTSILMCAHETRRADYASYAAIHPEANAAWKDTKLDSRSATVGPDHPVVNVSWDDAKAFCAWLSQKEGRTYRLPTDREWSLAVGIAAQEADAKTTPQSLSGQLKDVYPWGSTWPPSKGAGNYADIECQKQIPAEKIIAGYADGFPLTSPVMSFPPNALGIHDLGGNVWEWCEDWYNADKKDHVLRGASWGSSAPMPLLASFRGNQPSTRRWRCDGFRCVVEVVP
ncbi:serine hydrolase [Prosthecobacter sp.]|uniref:serine hydrolase n=1 Tax=Prosthecobacter sp. TaxID=1965333 RepID=UPI003782F211